MARGVLGSALYIFLSLTDRKDFPITKALENEIQDNSLDMYSLQWLDEYKGGAKFGLNLLDGILRCASLVAPIQYLFLLNSYQIERPCDLC